MTKDLYDTTHLLLLPASEVSVSDLVAPVWEQLMPELFLVMSVSMMLELRVLELPGSQVNELELRLPVALVVRFPLLQRRHPLHPLLG